MIFGFSHSTPTPIGQLALQLQFAPRLTPPYVRSYAGATARRTVEASNSIEEFYPLQYITDGSPTENLRFALKHEPLDFRIIVATLKDLDPFVLEEWIRAEPTGAYSRRVWFFYEKFLEKRLDVEDATRGNYVDALDGDQHYVTTPINSRRHRVRDNLLGGARLCPVVRRSAKLKPQTPERLVAQARQITSLFSDDTIARAVNFLYTKETRSSFAIEGETPNRSREERFLQALRKAPEFLPTSLEALVDLQGRIVDPRYAAQGWRQDQNFVGETMADWSTQVHFICPQPEDVPLLMSGWLEMTERLRDDSIDAVVAAAVIAFAFVFIHPFNDGNGRIHRFLFHAFLAARHFGPSGMILPVSAAILRKKKEYDRILEAFSQPLMGAIDWTLKEDRGIEVTNSTLDLYRFFDATAQVEFLYDRLTEAIGRDLKDEASFLQTFDAATTAVREVVDMPDRRAAALVKICLNNRGVLSANKRNHFSELTDDEVQSIGKRLSQICKETNYEFPR